MVAERCLAEESSFGRELLRAAPLLKGGTPLNLAFGTPTRLWVDLAYNYVGAADRETMLADRPYVTGTVAQIAERSGYRAQRSAEEFADRKFFLSDQAALACSGLPAMPARCAASTAPIGR